MMELPSQQMLGLMKAHGNPKANQEDLIWFIAVCEAQGERDSYDLKDSAQDVMEGKLPLIQRLDVTINEMFDGWHKHAIVGMIHEHYGKG